MYIIIAIMENTFDDHELMQSYADISKSSM